MNCWDEGQWTKYGGNESGWTVAHSCWHLYCRHSALDKPRANTVNCNWTLTGHLTQLRRRQEAGVNSSTARLCFISVWFISDCIISDKPHLVLGQEEGVQPVAHVRDAPLGHTLRSELLLDGACNFDWVNIFLFSKCAVVHCFKHIFLFYSLTCCKSLDRGWLEDAAGGLARPARVLRLQQTIPSQDFSDNVSPLCVKISAQLCSLTFPRNMLQFCTDQRCLSSQQARPF